MVDEPMAQPSTAQPDEHSEPQPVLPDYTGACIANLIPALVARGTAAAPAWLPGALKAEHPVVVLVVDGLGWMQLQDRGHLAPNLMGGTGVGQPITSVAPTTTAAALTSLTTGVSPSTHGILGYRMAVDDEIMNVLHWTAGLCPPRDLRRERPPAIFQPFEPLGFNPDPIPVVSRHEFSATGFTAAHLGRSPIVGYRTPSALPIEISRLVAAQVPFVYAYIDGLDKVAHAYGLGEHYEAELAATDHLIGQIIDRLPANATLVVTADHGQVEVGNSVEFLGASIMSGLSFLSGEGRFRWLHARPGATDDLVAEAKERYGTTTWVRTRSEVVDAGWFGDSWTTDVISRLGDVLLAPHAPMAFADPSDVGENRLVGRHGSLTAEEVLVPLITLQA